MSGERRRGALRSTLLWPWPGGSHGGLEERDERDARLGAVGGRRLFSFAAVDDEDALEGAPVDVDGERAERLLLVPLLESLERVLFGRGGHALAAYRA